MLGKGEDGHVKRPKHMSADDLNDGFTLDRDGRHLLSYKVRYLPAFSSSFKNTLVFIQGVHFIWKV
jgi:hypothetical protein